MIAATNTRSELLKLIPLDAVRVKVKTEKGNDKYRTVDPQNGNFDEILDSDQLVLVNGNPVTMNKKPGRKKAVPPAKVPPPINAIAAQLMAAKKEFLDNDPLLRQIEQGVESEDILLLVMRGFAQESASLEFERLEAERNNRETSQLSIRRINALKALGDSFLKRKDQLSGKTIDMASPAFGRLFAFMTATFREAMLNGGVSRDHAEAIFSWLNSRILDDSWEQEALNKMKGD